MMIVNGVMTIRGRKVRKVKIIVTRRYTGAISLRQAFTEVITRALLKAAA